MKALTLILTLAIFFPICARASDCESELETLYAQETALLERVQTISNQFLTDGSISPRTAQARMNVVMGKVVSIRDQIDQQKSECNISNDGPLDLQQQIAESAARNEE